VPVTVGLAYFYHLDNIGLPRMLTNESGATVWSATARPFGDVTEATTFDTRAGKTVGTNLRLPGQYDEHAFELLGFGAGPLYGWHRWYLPGMGRYLSPEPMLQSPDYVSAMARRGMSAPTYAYANNNPLTYTDPTGKIPAVPIAIGIGVGEAFAERAKGKVRMLTPREIIIAAAANPVGGMERLLREARAAMATDDDWAPSLAYTVLGLSLEHSMCHSKNADVIAWLLSHPNTLSLPVIARIRQFATATNDTSLLTLAEEAGHGLP